ncbi:MAG: FliH/SctL family protein [Fimbriimonadales bacterium]|nr:FliH/SctL family protein [Fimbriimonadales bacterium]
MRPPFPTLDELHSTDSPVRAERSTGVSPVRTLFEQGTQRAPSGTGSPVRADLLGLSEAISKQPAPSSPLSHRVGAGGQAARASLASLQGRGDPAAEAKASPPLRAQGSRYPFPEYIPSPKPEAAPDLDAIRAEAEAIRLRALQDAERIREQARREGYQLGYEQGYADGDQHARQQAETTLQQTIAQLRHEVEQVIQSVQSQYEAYLRHAEAQMLELALEVARKIVREELRIQPEHALAIVRDALRRVQGFVHIRIRVNPLDLELIRQNRAALLHIVDGVEGIEIVEDRRVDQGGCIIETEQGVYDARIKTQLGELERVIREVA